MIGSFVAICTPSEISQYKKNLQQIFNKEELLEFYSRKTQVSKTEWLTSRFALKKAFCKYIRKHIPYHEIQITKNNLSLPSIKTDSSLYCSVSHSKLLGAAIVSKTKVGIDIEVIKPRSKELASYIASNTEIDLVKQHCRNASEIITTLWTIKESVLKAIGIGLQTPINQIIISEKIGEGFLVQIEYSNTSLFWKVTVYNNQIFILSIAKPYEFKTLFDWNSISSL